MNPSNENNSPPQCRRIENGAPPPPYTPAKHQSTPSTLPTLVSQHQFQQQAQQQGRIQATIQPTRALVTSVFTTTTDDDGPHSQSDQSISPLRLHINTSINISKNNNLICLSESPARHANAIAEAVTEAIRRTSSGNCGIPMIDGNGNPRPIRIAVEAGVTVEGAGNVVGSEGVIMEVLRQRDEFRRQREWVEGNSTGNSVGGQSGTSSSGSSGSGLRQSRGVEDEESVSEETCAKRRRSN